MSRVSPIYSYRSPQVAVLVPCYNEELTIGKVVEDFRRELPHATIYVYDNNSTDTTAQVARSAGAEVRREFRQGKGNVVRSMFRDIDADVYVMVDGDDTYPASFVHDLIVPIIQCKADMSIGDRLSNGSYSNSNRRPFHDLGNRIVRAIINALFRAEIHDIMTGYRAFNRGFVKTMPILSRGFEIETEMTLHALDKNHTIVELPIVYRDRPDGSFSKLNTFRDGLKVLRTIFSVFKNYKPMMFFSILSFVFFIAGIAVGLPVLHQYIMFHYVYKLPSAVLAVGLELLSTIFLTSGIILDTIVKQHREQYELLIRGFPSSPPSLGDTPQ